MSARAMWLESRRAGIGGSDAAAILGLDPWRGPIDVFRSKLEKPEPDANEKFLIHLGHLLEPVIAGLYSEQTGRVLTIPDPAIVQHAEFPELLGSPDRLGPALDGDRGRVIELKSEHQFADKFGDPGTDQIPDHYVVQCLHYMGVCDRDRCDVAVLHGGFKFAIYQLGRDREAEKELFGQLREWWDAYVVKKIEPPLDASEAWGNYLATKYPFNRGPLVEVTENSHPDLIRRVYNVLNYGEQIKLFKSRLEEARNNVKAFIAENDGIRGPWGKITWRLCKDTTESRINYERILDTLELRYKIPPTELVDLREEFTESIVTKTGGRRFVAKRAKDLDSPIPESEENFERN
jgi:putative phage-type endonuclease